MIDRTLGIATPAAMLVALYFALIYAPTEATMGTVQRIFYFHVPLGWIGMVSIIVVAIAMHEVVSVGAAKRKTRLKPQKQKMTPSTRIPLMRPPSLWSRMPFQTGAADGRKKK